MQEKWLYGYEGEGPGEIEFHPIRMLSDDEYDAVRHAIKTVLDVLTGPTSFSELARRDMARTFIDLSQRLGDLDESRKVEIWGPELEYRIVSVSSAVRMHEEFVLTTIQKRKDPTAEASAKAIFNRTYDGSQAYRIIYSLRNALVHGSKGLTTLGSKSTMAADGTTSAAVSINLSRDRFAASDAKTAVRGEVRAMAEDPELMQLANVALDDLAAMRRDLEPLLYPEAPAASQLIYSYVHEVHASGFGAPHFHAHDPGDPFGHMSTIGMTRSIFDYVLASVRN
ncbi:hypothetical protein E3O11_12715 [Cryobacterium levicorallinum]|uniref:Uncharacterized protein n=1 Tax=Cryobacterium levicorallinum TaxID=995038 RepID=A0A1I3A0X8_9MICO|nr:hypothetical protein [Cryobacterium levicorallinum]TFB82730.1 hypothetical protein E3O11_12715 [Cryobacterium levicorallinum]SFH43550.1 hypothetical protein SAMN05216274_10595 [Cryobacterium levicorallinum]